MARFIAADAEDGEGADLEGLDFPAERGAWR